MYMFVSAHTHIHTHKCAPMYIIFYGHSVLRSTIEWANLNYVKCSMPSRGHNWPVQEDLQKNPNYNRQLVLFRLSKSQMKWHWLFNPVNMVFPRQSILLPVPSKATPCHLQLYTAALQIPLVASLNILIKRGTKAVCEIPSVHVV